HLGELLRRYDASLGASLVSSFGVSFRTVPKSDRSVGGFAVGLRPKGTAFFARTSKGRTVRVCGPWGGSFFPEAITVSFGLISWFVVVMLGQSYGPLGWVPTD